MDFQRIKKIAIPVLSVILIISIGGVIVHEINYYRAEKSYEQAAALTQQSSEPEPEPEPEPKPEPEPEDEFVIDEVLENLITMDLSELSKTNEDVFGWITIPDTTVAYPLLQGDDNSHYLKYSWDGLWNPVGSIFLDYRNQQDFTEFHTIIYGHRMYNDSMFNSLKNYKELSYMEEHPYVYIRSGNLIMQYEVFSAYEAATDSPAWRLGLESAEDRQLLI